MAGTNSKNGLYAFQVDKELGYTIGDFSQDKEEAAPIGNKTTNNNLAAYASVLGASDPNDVVANYMRINDEQSLIGQSQTQTQLLSQVRSQTQAEYTPSLLTTLANPGISDEDKQRAINNVYDQNSRLYTPANVLTSRTLSAPTSNSNKEEDNVRLNIGNFSQRMNAEKEQAQSVLNNALNRNNPTSKSKVLNFIDSLVPGATTLAQVKIAAGMDPDHAITAGIKAFFRGVGNNKEKLVDMINNAPPEKRQAVLETIADVINNHSGILSSDPNYDQNRQLLQEVLTDNYSNVDKIKDNIGGWVDTAAIAASAADGIVSGVKSIKAARSAAKEEDLFSQYKADFEANTKGFKPDSYGDPINPTGKGPDGSGGPSRGATFDLKGPETVPGSAEAVQSNVSRDMVKSRVQPVSVAQNVKDTNPDMSRAFYDAVDRDSTHGKVAEAVYGTDRTDALANDVLPEVGHADGSVTAKVSSIDGAQQLREIREQVPDELLDFANHDGLTHYTQGEIAKTRAWKVSNFEDAIAMNPRPEMFQIQPGTKNLADTSTGFTIRGVYGPADHGYSSAQDAMELADYALRSTGIPTEDITLLKRVGGKYVPTTLEAEMGNVDPGFRVGNPRDSYNAGQYATATVKGKEIRVVGEINPNNPNERTVHAYDPKTNKRIGEVKYVVNGNTSIKKPQAFKDTRNGTVQFHGTSEPFYDGKASNDYAMSGDNRNIFGQGFYTTDSAKTASGYMKKGRGANPTLYKIVEKPGVKLYDMEAKLTPKMQQIVSEVFGDLLPTENLDTGAPISNLRELYNEFRAESSNNDLSRDEVQSYFDAVRARLEAEGYNGLRHIGGANKGSPHTVKIYFTPEDSLSVTKDDIANYYETVDDNIDNPDLKVDKKFRRQGVATAMYSYIEKHGDNIPSADTQQLMRTDAGNAFRTSLAAGKAPPVMWKQTDGGDYLIGIDHNYRVNAADYKAAGASENLDVKNNFLDRGALTDGRQGSAANTLLDIGSMLHPTIYKGALVAADKGKYFEKQLLNMFNEFATPFSKLPRERQRLLLGEIYKANEKSVAFNYNSLMASGATPKEIGILKAFEKSQNTLYYFRNEAYAKYLNRQGFQEYVHTGAQTNLVARPVSKGNLGVKPSGFDVYDAMSDKNVRMSAADIDTIYKNGGTFAELKHPFIGSDGNVVTHVQAGNTMTGGYMKAITPSTQVLAYRPGYFGVEYNHDHIIMEQEIDKAGKVFNEHAVATARDAKAAKLQVNRMNATSNGNRYYHRKNTSNKVNRSVADDYDVSVANGQSAFRRRGKRLVDTNSNNSNLDKLNIKNPAEVFVRSARSLSNKVAYSDVIGAMDVRAANQYGHLLPKNQFNQTMIPGDKRQIRYRGIGNEDGSEIADARTTIQYNNYLRTGGYINLLDDATKAGFRSLADMLGAKDLAMAEHLFSGLSDISITRIGKTAAYTAFLALSPLRQFIVQSSQISLLAAINPSWMAGKFIPQMLYMSMRQMGLQANHPIANVLAKGFGLNATAADADIIWKQFLRSGVSSAIDSSNMISGVLSDMASRMINKTSKHVTAPIRAVKAGLHGIRLIGFDAGEWINSASSWMAHRDLAVKAGANINDPRVLDNITATARNYTGAMNHAGDSSYNQNALSMVAQFTQQVHKMAANLTTSRIITAGDKVKMTFLLLGLFGLPSSLIWSKWTNDVLPDDPKDPSHQAAKKALDQGLEGYALNHIMSAITRNKVDMDWAGSLSPFNAYGTADLIHNLLTTDAGTIVAKTPAGSLFFGQNPRVLNFAKSVARYTNLMDDYKNPTEFKEVAENFLKISSGYSSYAKAKYAMEYNRKVSALGRTTDGDVSPTEALLAAAGINTEDEKRQFAVNNALFATKTQKEADFNKFYKDLKVHLNYKYPDATSMEFVAKSLSEFNRVYGDDPQYRQWMDSKLKYDVANGDASVYTNLMRMSNLYGKGDIHALIDQYPFKSEESRQGLKDQIDYFDTTDPTEK